MKKNLIKVFIFLIAVGLFGALIRYVPQIFAAGPEIDISSIINTGCIEYTTPEGTVQKCDDVEIYYADDVYPVKKWQKTLDMTDFTDEEIDVVAGEYISYKVDFVNLGEEDIVGTVKDYMPNCVSFITGSLHGDGISNAVFEHNTNNTQVWFRGIRLHPGQSGYMLITGQISNSENCQSVTRYINTGSFKSTSPSGTELFDSVTALRHDTGNPLLQVDKILLTAGYVPAGGTVSYKIIARNVGSGVATGVSLYDEIPAVLQYVSSEIDVPSDFGTGTTGNTMYIEYSGITLEPNGVATVYLTGIVKEGYVFNHTVQNCVTASGNNITAVKDCVSPEPEPELDVVKELLTTGYIPAGGTVVYKITAENVGGGVATGVTIHDDLPEEIQYSMSSITVPSYSSYSFGTGTTGNTMYIEYSGITLNERGKAIVYLTGIVKEGYEFNNEVINCVTVSGSNASAVTDCVVPDLQLSPELQVVKELLTLGNLSTGDDVVYKITARNVGSGVATGVTIHDDLPVEIQYSMSSITVPSYSSYSFGTGTTGNTMYIEYSGITLEPNGVATVYLTGKLVILRQFENCVNVFGSNVQADVTCTGWTPPSPPSSGDITITKTVNKRYVESGDGIQYTITYTNNSSTKPLYNYKIVDIWPNNDIRYDRYTSSVAPYNFIDESANNRLTWEFTGPLNPNASAEIIIYGTVK